ncbi:M48 family metalloprotease [Limnobacter parvus]|uniref:M48 family metalloprotease n=1 Tax=Limnobacter parvus TaxID=2939690 RepID=A0ABT1XKI5_9BURK|nr:M48 family metalloprotease [Limnobacter parvus]MCR2747805.1 M48 family metalloprotease [Limnobacter parvus]
MADYSVSNDSASRELEVLKLSVLFDSHFFNGLPTQVHFTHNSSMVGTWVDHQGVANLSVSLDRIRFMNSDQLAFLIAHEYGHLVLKHPEKTVEIQQQFGVASTFDEFMLSFDMKREYSKLMREMEIQADLFGAKLALGLGRDPELGASFLLGETKGIQHPEGTLRVAKIKSEKESMAAEDFSDTFDSLAVQLGDAEVLAALLPSNLVLYRGDTPAGVKAAVESWSEPGMEPAYAGGPDYGFEVSILLTLAVLACALPRWWRKTSGG